MEKLFTVAGVSTLNGVVKFRFANDLEKRVAVLTRNGHTDIQLVTLPQAMNKRAAIEYLESIDLAAPVAVAATEAAETDAAEAVADAVAEPDEAAIAAIVATLPKRTPRGHFVKREVLREQAIALLTA
jgi:hypothetical protein